jgi:hypothetical protein
MAKTKYFEVLAAAAGALVAVALLGLVLVLVKPQTAGAALPGTNGKIAYVAWDGNDTEIFTIDPTGGMPFPVTKNNVNDRDPSYSPDGTEIAFSGHGGLAPTPADLVDFEIITIPANGGNPFQVTQTPAGFPGFPASDEQDPSYSPDGKKIAYSRDRGTGDSDIFTKPASGGISGDTGQITFGVGPTDDSAPSWSATRNEIAYQGFAGYDREIFTVDAKYAGLNPGAGGPVNTPRQVTHNNLSDISPDYRPDGNKIVYSVYDGNDLEIFSVLRFPLFGGLWLTPTQITDNNTDDLHPVYSPNAQQIAYSGFDGNDFEIFTIPATGGTRSQVTNSPTNEVQPSWQPRP